MEYYFYFCFQDHLTVVCVFFSSWSSSLLWHSTSSLNLNQIYSHPFSSQTVHSGGLPAPYRQTVRVSPHKTKEIFYFSIIQHKSSGFGGTDYARPAVCLMVVWFYFVAFNFKTRPLLLLLCWSILQVSYCEATDPPIPTPTLQLVTFSSCLGPHQPHLAILTKF